MLRQMECEPAAVMSFVSAVYALAAADVDAAVVVAATFHAGSLLLLVLLLLRRNHPAPLLSTIFGLSSLCCLTEILSLTWAATSNVNVNVGVNVNVQVSVSVSVLLTPLYH